LEGRGGALEAAGRCFHDWFEGRGGREAGEVQVALSQVRLFIEQHGDSRFEPLIGTLGAISFAPSGSIINGALKRVNG
jgi:hypothetical protein